jgi:chromosomal replication initiation ATPase DnaA
MALDEKSGGIDRKMGLAAVQIPFHDMTFDTFVPANDNAAALQWAILVADQGPTVNIAWPLFIYGDAGVGKTHLLTSIANGVTRFDALLINVGKLRAECEASWRNSLSVNLKDYLIEPDLLLLDDIHLAGASPAFQTELLSVVELRLKANLGVVMSSRMPPSALVSYDDKVNRVFGGGVIEHLSLKDPKTRCEILRRFLGRSQTAAYFAEVLASIDCQNGHRLKELASVVTAQPEMTNLLHNLGYRIASVIRYGVGDRAHIHARWQMDFHDHTDIVDLYYFLRSKKVVNRCWSTIR